MPYLIRHATLNVQEVQKYTVLLNAIAKSLVLPLVLRYKKLPQMNVEPTNTDILMALDDSLKDQFNKLIEKNLSKPCELSLEEVKQVLAPYIKTSDWSQYFVKQSTDDRVETITPDICKTFIKQIAPSFQSKANLLNRLNDTHLNMFNSLLKRRISSYAQPNFNLQVRSVDELKDILTDYVPGSWAEFFEKKSSKHVTTLFQIRKECGKNVYDRVQYYIGSTIKKDLSDTLEYLNDHNPKFVTELKQGKRVDDVFDLYVRRHLSVRVSQALNAQPDDFLVHLDPAQIQMDPFMGKFLMNQIHTAIKKYLLSNPDETRLANLLRDSAFASRFYQICDEALKEIFSEKSISDYIHANNIAEKYESYVALDSTTVFQFNFNRFKDIVASKLNLSEAVVNNPSFDKYLNVYATKDNLEKILQMFYKNLNKLVLPLTRLKLKHLEDENYDRIGQSHTIDIERFDQNNREKAFVILNGRLLIGRPGETHVNIIERLKNMPPESFYRNGIEDILKGKFDSLAYGHIVDGLAFFDVRGMQGNLTVDQAINIIKNGSPKITKVYTDVRNRDITRLAKLYAK